MTAGEPDDHLRRIRTVPDPQQSRSMEYGAVMLECFTAERTALGISALAHMIGISRSTTHRYAVTLVKLGYLEQDSERRYRLSHNAARPGMTAIETIRRETPATTTILEDLREQTGHTVSMGVLDGTHVTYTHRLFAHGQGQHEVDLELGVGAHVPAYCTAIGKALLASLAENKQAEVLAALTLRRHGPKTITSKRVLAGELERLRLQGIALCDEEQAPNVRSIAKTIRDPRAARPMAISVTAPARDYTVERITAEFQPHVQTAAARISALTTTNAKGRGAEGRI